ASSSRNRFLRHSNPPGPPLATAASTSPAKCWRGRAPSLQAPISFRLSNATKKFSTSCSGFSWWVGHTSVCRLFFRCLFHHAQEGHKNHVRQCHENWRD